MSRLTFPERSGATDRPTRDRFDPVRSPAARGGPDRAPGDDRFEDSAGSTAWREVLLSLSIGAAAAIAVFALLPGNFPWFLCAIPHEMGHATVGSLLGMPSTPAISLRGEAWTGHGLFRPWLAIAIGITCAGFALAMRRRPAAGLALAVAAVALPICAFTGAGRVLTISAGHLAELAFATYCYVIAVTGGRTDTRGERIAAATAGAILQFVNLRLLFGLMTSAAARANYAGNGSLGIKNDYLKLAEDVFACRLESVAFVMLLLALLPLPLGLLIGHWRNRAGSHAR